MKTQKAQANRHRGWVVAVLAATCFACHVAGTVPAVGKGEAVEKDWILPEGESLPTSVVPGVPGSAWVVGSSGRLYRLDPRGEVTPVDVMLDGGPAQVQSAAAGRNGVLWLVVAASSGTMSQGRFRIAEGRFEAVPGPEVRSLGGEDAAGAVWMLGPDNRLLRWSDGNAVPADEGRYNALVLSPDGRRIAARQSGTDEIMTSGTATLDWKRAREDFGGRLAGVGDNGTLFLLELAPWVKGRPAPRSRLVSLLPGGEPSEITAGPWPLAAVAGSDRFVVEVRDSRVVVRRLEP